MSNILTIVFRLTISCLVAGLIMGTTFVFTNKAKKANGYAREEKVVYSLLGYSKEKPIPPSIKLNMIFRYVVSEPSGQSIGYLLPVDTSSKEESYRFVRLGLDGSFLDNTPVPLSEDKVRAEKERTEAISKALGAGKALRYADQTIVVTNNKKRSAYLLTGSFPGFKTHVSVMLALDPAYSILGLEILEHEEDPGLGGEIEKKYFKNQFKYKPFDKIKNLQVVKEPLPPKYYDALEGKIEEKAARNVMKEYEDKDIYALTGATISSASVTTGVKGMTKKFAYRLDILDQVLKNQHIAVPF